MEIYMRNFYKLMTCLGLLISLSACQEESQSLDTDSEQASVSNSEKDSDNYSGDDGNIQGGMGPLEIDPDTTFLTMDPDQKAAAYQAIDKVNQTNGQAPGAGDYPQIAVIKTETDFQDQMTQSDREPFILYLGFDQCPYCQAFSPKISHLAKELDVPIYYYNSQDHDISDLAKEWKLETVPQALIIQNGQMKARLDHLSKMQDIENFLYQYKDIIESGLSVSS